MNSQSVSFDSHLFNPLYWHIKKALEDPNIYIILVNGGSSAGKTYEISQNLCIGSLERNVSTMVLRKESTSISDSVYSDFRNIGTKINNAIGTKYFNFTINRVIAGATKFRFRGLDSSEKIKGLSNYLYVFMNEISSFEKNEFSEVKRRLRGRPGQKIIADWNPIDENHWLKTDIIDMQEWVDLPLSCECPNGAISQLSPDYSDKKISKDGKILYIKTTYRDNFWVSGHPTDSQYGYRDEKAIYVFERMAIESPREYQIYGLGNWGKLKTGGEFLHGFQMDRHVKVIAYNPDCLFHVSIDNNFLPYIAITFWQISKESEVWKVREVYELPVRHPDNSASKAGQKAAEYLKRIGYSQKVFICGDKSTKSRNTINDEAKTFCDLFTNSLSKNGYTVQNKMLTAPPSVSDIADFVNACLNEDIGNIRIEIGANCKTSISDFIETKQDKDGNIVKNLVKDPNGQGSYQPHGHIVDTFKDMMIQVFINEYNIWKRNSNPFKPSYGKLAVSKHTY